LRGGCCKSPGEPAGSVLRPGSENGQVVRRARAAARHAGALDISGTHFREGAAPFPRRLCATASAKSGRRQRRRAWPSTWVVRSLSDAIQQWNATGRGPPGRAILAHEAPSDDRHFLPRRLVRRRGRRARRRAPTRPRARRRRDRQHSARYAGERRTGHPSIRREAASPAAESPAPAARRRTQLTAAPTGGAGDESAAPGRIDRSAGRVAAAFRAKEQCALGHWDRDQALSRHWTTPMLTFWATTHSGIEWGVARLDPPGGAGVLSRGAGC
jgi:hypothetical protein